MTERTIFLRALACQTPESRAAYLDEACAGNAELRAQVESLLKAHSAGAGPVDELIGSHEPTSSCLGPNGASEPESLHDEADLSFLGPGASPGSIGTIGGYDVLELLGRGGMGVVLKARDPKLQRIVAIKVLAPEIAANKTAKRRFEREAQAAAAVSHDHIVTIYAVDEFNGLPFIVMECIVGRTLQEKIEEYGPLELKEILRIAMQSAMGLAAAHQQGLVHRDIKPANILLQNGIQRVKIADFGLARAADDVAMTHSGQIAGTPMYMSPEQAQGQKVDHLSDLFSLGSVMYSMCTGRPAFRADSTVAVLRRVCDDTPRPIRDVNPDLPEWLVDIVNKLLAKDKPNRIQTADELAGLLSERLAQLQEPRSSANPHGAAGHRQAAERDHQNRRSLPDQRSFGHRSFIRLLPLVGILVIVGVWWVVLQMRPPVETAPTSPMGPGFHDVRDDEPADRGNPQLPSSERADLTSPGDSSPNETVDATRTFAAWAFSRGGSVAGPDGQWVKSANDLPPHASLLMHVDFSQNEPGKPPLTDNDIERFQDLPDIGQHLIFRNQQITDAGIRRLAVLLKDRQIGGLNLVNMPVRLSALSEPYGFSTIHNLILINTSTTNADLALLEKFPKLDTLQVRSHPHITDESLTYLKYLPDLGSLMLDNTGVSDAGLPQIAQLTKLRDVRLDGTRVSMSGLRTLRAALPHCQIVPEPTPAPRIGLQRSAIPDAEQFPWQPRELVGVIGYHELTHWRPVSSVAANGDGTALLSTGDDGIWIQPSLDRRAQYFPGRENYAISTLWHEQFGFLTVHRDGTINRWGTADPIHCEKQWQLPPDTRLVRLSADGRVLVAWVVPETTWYDLYKLPHCIGETIVFDVSGQELQERFRVPRTGPPAVTPSGRWLTYHHLDAQQIERRDAAAPDAPIVSQQTFASPARYVETPREDRLVTQTVDQRLQWWDVSGDAFRELSQQVLTGHSGDYTGLSVSQEGSRIALVRFGSNHLEVIDVADDQFVPRQMLASRKDRGMHCGCVSGNGQLLAGGNDIGRISCFHWESDRFVDRTPNGFDLYSETGASYLPTPQLTSAGDGSCIGLMDVGNSAARAQLFSLTAAAPVLLRSPEGESPNFRRVCALNDDGSIALAPTPYAERNLWRMTGDVLSATALPDEFQQMRSNFSDDGRLLAATSHAELVVYDVSTRLVERLAKSDSLGNDTTVWSVAFQRGSSRVVAITHPKDQRRELTLRVFDLQDQVFQELFSKPLSNVTAALSRHGSHLAVGYPDGVVESYEIQPAALKKLGEIKLASPAVALDISPTGRQLLTSGPDHEVRIWNTADGGLVQSWEFPGRVYEAIFLGESGHVLTANANQTAYVLKFGP